MKRYELSVTKPEYWNKIHNVLIVDSNQDGIPDRQVTCTDSKEHSPTRGTYELTEEEAAEIAAHPYVKWIELSPIDNPDAYPKPDFATKRFKKNVKFYRDVLSSGIPATNPTSAELDRSNWGVGRASVRKSGTFFSDNSNTVTVEERDVSYQLTGRNIDIIVHDSGVLQYHPEFMDANGQSRVRDIILDGPYYIDPDYFISNGYTTTRADGRVTGSETESRAWWTNSSNRSAQFQSEGTISVSSLYTEARSMGASLDGANSLTDGHGTAVASLIAGKNFGHAFEANIWNMPGIGDAVGMDIETNYDAMKIWIRNRPVNSTTKRKNPVIINGSWGYNAAFASSSTVSYQYKGSTGTFTGNDAAVADTITALKEGIYTSRYATQYRSWATSSRSAATDTAANEMMLEGPIYVAAAGNDNLYLGKGSDDPHRLNYMSDTYFGTTDPRSEFPSGTVPCSHRDWMNPQGIGFDETKDFHPVVCVGALEDTVTTGGAEYQAPYSNNGPGIDVWAPADETLAAGGVFSNGGYNDYERYDDSRFYDASFNGTSAAAPVACGVIALYLEGNPNADSRAVQNWIRDNGTLLGITTSSTIGEGFFSQYNDTTDVNYWTGDYNLRGADPRVIYSPYATEEVPVIDPGTEKIIQDELVLELDGHNHTTDDNRWYNSAKDSSHVTLSSGITYDGYGYVFSDFNQGSFTKNSDFEFISDFTFESWFYMTQQPGSTNPSALFSSWSTVNNVNNKFIFYLNSSYKFVYELDNGNSYGGIGLVMSDTVSLNTWNHVVVTRSGSDISCYLNNVKDATVQTYSSTITPTLNDIRIGDYAGSDADSFTGTIGMIRFYRRSFSDNDVKQHYDEQVGRFDGSLRPSLMLDGISFSYE